MDRSLRSRRDWLLTAALIFLAANLFHTADHVRQGIGDVRTTVIAAGTILTVSAFALVLLALRRHHYTASLAIVIGFQAVIGISASHIAPDWGALSDSYPKIHADALSWAVMLLEVAAGFFLGVIGVQTRAQERGANLMRASSEPIATSG